MTTPPPPPPPRRPASRGLRLRDLFGLVVGYSLAALLARTFRSSSRPLASVTTVAFALEYLWLGLAMSGPILLLLDRRAGAEGGEALPKRFTPRLGRPIHSQPVVEPVGRRAYVPKAASPPRYTKAELAWMAIGGYWICLTVLVVPALSIDTPWALVGLFQVIAAVGLWVVVPGQRREDPGTTWTHAVGLALIWTWPVAWGLLILLGKSH